MADPAPVMAEPHGITWPHVEKWCADLRAAGADPAAVVRADIVTPDGQQFSGPVIKLSPGDAGLRVRAGLP